MARFLDLVNQVASDSATFTESEITTVVGQVERKAKVVRWTNMAWRLIQNYHKGWRWMQSEFSLSTVAATQRYAGTGCTDAFSLAAITRFAEWTCRGLGEDRFKLYDPAIGIADIGRLTFVPWEDFYVRSVNTNADDNKPILFSIDDQNQIAFSPVPDAVYTVRGPYRKSVQTLALDADEPDMPSDFHDLIAWVAVQMLGTHDESPQIPLWKMRENELFCRLEARQLPQIRVGGPLA